MSAIAKRAQRRLDALERAAKLVEKWRDDANIHCQSAAQLKDDRESVWLRGYALGAKDCASELQEALEGE